jgi:osmoprotectant transport system substrate-binding protein
MRGRFRKGAIGAVLMAVALVATACGSGDDADSGAKDGPTITIGSANFSESALVAEIYAQALEADGYPVDRNLNVGSREIYWQALQTGDLGLLPEYTGALLTFLGGTSSSDGEATYDALVNAAAAVDVVVFEPAPAQDKDGFAVTAETAEELGVEKVSDLAEYNGTLILGASPECPERPYCLLGLEDVYGLAFAEVKALDVGGPLTVAALEGGEIDVGLLFTSDGVIAAKGFVLLEDDKVLQPAQNVAPVLRKEIADAYGDDLRDRLDAVSEVLTTQELILLNKAVGADGEDPETVATDWLAENNLT